MCEIARYGIPVHFERVGVDMIHIGKWYIQTDTFGEFEVNGA